MFRAHFEAFQHLPSRIYTDSNVVVTNVSYYWDTQSDPYSSAAHENAGMSRNPMPSQDGMTTTPPGDPTMSARMRLCELFGKGIPHYQLRQSNQWSVTEATTTQKL
jgi:hypothetical protein